MLEMLSEFRDGLWKEPKKPMSSEELKAKYLALFHKDKKAERDTESHSITPGSQSS